MGFYGYWSYFPPTFNLRISKLKILAYTLSAFSNKDWRRFGHPPLSRFMGGYEVVPSKPQPKHWHHLNPLNTQGKISPVRIDNKLSLTKCNGFVAFFGKLQPLFPGETFEPLFLGSGKSPHTSISVRGPNIGHVDEPEFGVTDSRLRIGGRVVNTEPDVATIPTNSRISLWQTRPWSLPALRGHLLGRGVGNFAADFEFRDSEHDGKDAPGHAAFRRMGSTTDCSSHVQFREPRIRCCGRHARD